MDKKQVFISYKSEEFEEANWVRGVLETNGISCWMAPMCITGGSSYAVEIPQAIRNCKVFVLILSEKSQESKWVPREVDQAINENKIIMPFMLENCALKDDFNFYLTNVQRYAAYESKASAIEKMLREIKAILRSEETKQQAATKQEEPKQEAPKQEVPKQEVPKPEAPKPQVTMQDLVQGTFQNATVRQVPVQPAKPQKKKKTMSRVLIPIVAVIFAIIIGSVIINKLTHVTIAGQKVKKSTYYISFHDEVITWDDLERISKLKNISDISFYDCKINSPDLGLLANKNFTYLTFENCDLNEAMVESLNLEKMTELSHLNLNENPKLTKIEGIEAAAGALRYLAINDTNITNIDFLKGFANLEEFQADNTGITSVEVLGDCRKLYAISVNGNKLTSLKGLETTIYLQSVEAGYNELGGIDELRNNVNLKTVYLNHNKIRDISALTNANTQLKSLFIDDNQISDVSCLNGSVALEYFSADRNQIADISALQQSTALKEISMTGNKLTSLSGLENCANLTFLNVSHNQISNASALSNFSFQSEYGCYVDISHNKIAEVKLKDSVNLSFFNIYDNQLTSLIFGNGSTINTLVYEYQAEMDYEVMAEQNVKYHYIVNCPLDQKVNLTKTLSSVLFYTPDTLKDIHNYGNDEISGEYLYTPPEE